MSEEEINGTEVQEAEESNDTQSELSAEELRALLKAKNDENAKARIKNRELQAAADELAEIKRAQMSDLERVQAENKELNDKLFGFTVERQKRDVARSTEGLEESDWDLITGTSEDEMKSSAERLAKRVGKKSTGVGGSPHDLFPGSQGKEPVTATDDDGQEWWNSFLNQRR